MHRLIVIGLFMLLAPAVFAESQLPYNVVSFQAQQSAEVPNDEVQISLAVEHEDRRANAVAQRINADMDWALKIARSSKQVKAETGQYGTYPRHKGNAIVGWRGTQQLMLKSKDIEAATELATQLQERLQVKSMQFVASKETRDKVEESLTIAVLNKFTTKAQRITKALNAEGYDLVDVNVNGNFAQPRPVYRQDRMMMGVAMEASAPAMAAEAGTSTITVMANGRIQLR